MYPNAIHHPVQKKMSCAASDESHAACAAPPSMCLTFTRHLKMQKGSLRYFPIALFSRDASIAARMHRQISPGTASTKQYSTTGQTPIGVPR